MGVSPLAIIRNLEFEDDQKTHQLSHLQMLRSAHQDIVHIMTRIHNIISNDGLEVCPLFFIQYCEPFITNVPAILNELV